MKKDFTFTYGTETRTVQLEEDLLNAPFVAPRATGGASRDPFEVMKEALANPVDRPKLRDMVGGKTVALIVSDEFRAGLQRKILDVLIEEIGAGKPTKLTVFCATGTHDPAIYAGNTEKWAMESSQKHGQPITFVGHSCDDPKLVHAGTTKRNTKVLLEPGWLEADVRVCGHEAKHHYMAGYSSVAKAVLPASRAA
jgi:nickel-dependent lactate racemase